MTFSFFKSDDVKIFPCSRRGSNGKTLYDSEARFTTETNLTQLFGLAFGRDSYIISKPVENNNVWKLVIHGYYFEIKNTFTPDEVDQIKYFVIGLEDTAGIPSKRLGVLALDVTTHKLGLDISEAKLDLVDGNDIFWCQAICAVSNEYVLSLSDLLNGLSDSLSDSCYVVSTQDTLDALDAQYHNGKLEGTCTSLLDGLNRLTGEGDGSVKKAMEEALSDANNYSDAQISSIVGTKASGTPGESDYKEPTGLYQHISDAVGEVDNKVSSLETQLKEQLRQEVANVENSAADSLTKAVNDLIGKEGDTADAQTISGAKKCTEELREDLDTQIEGLKSEIQSCSAAIDAEITNRQDAITDAVTELCNFEDNNNLIKGFVTEEITKLVNTQDSSSIEGEEPVLTLGDEQKLRIQKIKDLDTQLTAELTTLRDTIGNLQNVMNFRGAVLNLTSEEDDPWKPGDVVTIAADDATIKIDGKEVTIQKGSEWVFTEGGWVEIGTANISDAKIADLTAALSTLEDTVNYLKGAPDEGEDVPQSLLAETVARREADEDLTKEIKRVAGTIETSVANAITGTEERAKSVYATKDAVDDVEAGAKSYAEAKDATLHTTITGEIATAKSEAISAAASDATSRANTAEANAKSYADGLAGNYDTAGAAADTKAELIGDANSTKDSDTIKGVRLFAIDAVDQVKSELTGSDEDDAQSVTIAGAKAYADGLVANIQREIDKPDGSRFMTFKVVDSEPTESDEYDIGVVLGVQSNGKINFKIKALDNKGFIDFMSSTASADSALSDRVTQLESQYTDCNNNYSTLSSNYDTLRSDYSTLNSSVTQNTAELTELAQLKGLKAFLKIYRITLTCGLAEKPENFPASPIFVSQCDALQDLNPIELPTPVDCAWYDGDSLIEDISVFISDLTGDCTLCLKSASGDESNPEE